MKTYIVLLKGINVGGHRKVPMAELRTLLTKTGFQNVRTYIQTGNIAFETEDVSVAQIEDKVAKSIVDHFGFEVLVMVKFPEDIERILNNCPFEDDKKEKSYFSILKEVPSEDLIKLASQKTYENEEYTIIEDCIYYYGEKYSKAKFNINYFERHLKTVATTRNYNTMLKILALNR